MRPILALTTLGLSLGCLPGCSSMKGELTRGDLATFRLRDLTRFGQPDLVKVSPGEIAKLDRAKIQQGRMASFNPRGSSVPLPFVPPRLPAGSIRFDGSVLPPKNGNSAPLSDGMGYPAGVRQNFSIE